MVERISKPHQVETLSSDVVGKRALNQNSSPLFGMHDHLRALRKGRGYSLDELAARTDVTKGFLSLVERGLRVPSISTLLKLAQALDVPLRALLERPGAEPKPYSLVRSTERRKLVRPASAFGYRYRAIANHKDRARMEPFVLSPPLKSTNKQFQHNGEEMIYVLSGKIEFVLGLETFVLGPHDCLYFDASTPHRSRSLGSKRAVTLVIVSGEQ